MRQHVGRPLVLALLSMGLAALWILRTPWAGEKVCDSARARLPILLGMEVGLGQCTIDPLRADVEIRGFSLTPKGAEAPLFAADRVLARVRLIDLLTGGLHLERVEADRPRMNLDASELDLGGAPAEGCFVDILQRVEVDTLSLSGAEVHILAPGRRRVDLDEVDLDLRLSRHLYGVRVSVPRGRVDTGRVELPLSRLRFSVSLDLDRSRLTVSHLEVTVGEVALSAQGDVDTVCDPSLNLEASLYVPLDLASAVLGEQAPRMSGSMAVSLKKIEGPFRDPSIELEVTLAKAQVEGFDIGDAFLEARLEKKALAVDALSLAIGEGRGRVRGRIGLDRPFPVSASAELENVGFGRLLDKLTLHHAWVDFQGDAKLEVKGQLAPFRLTGPGSADVRDFRVYDRGWDRPDPLHVLELEQAHVDLVTDFDAERVRLLRGRVRTPRGSDVDANVTLYFDVDRGLDIEARPHELDLADLKHLVGIPWDGKALGQAIIKGPYAQPRIDGQVSLRDFKLHKLNVGQAEGQVRLRNFVLSFPEVTVAKGRSRFFLEGEIDLRSAPAARASGWFENARLSDLVDVIGDEHWVFDPLRGRSEARMEGRATLDRSPLLEPRATITTRFEDFTYLGRKLGDGELVFRAEDGERVVIDPLRLDGPCGRLSLQGKVELDEAVDLTLDAPLLLVEELAKPNGTFLRAQGTLSTRVRFYGPPERVQAEGALVVTDLGAFGAPLGSGTLGVTMDRTTLKLKGPIGADLRLDGRVVFEGELPFAVGAQASIADLGRYVPGVEGLQGALSGELFATGALARHEESQGDLLVTQAVAGKAGWSLRNAGPVALRFHGGRVWLPSAATVTGPAGLRLTALSGGGLFDGKLDVTLDGGFDARMIELWTPWVEQAGGRFGVNATFSGPPKKPEVVGQATLDSGRFAVRGYPVSGRDLRGSFEFSQNSLSIPRLEGVVNNGQAEVRGTVEMTDFVPRRLDLSATLDEVQLRLLESLPATFAGDLALRGPLDALELTGGVKLVRLRYTDEVDVDSLLRGTKHRGLQARSFDKRDGIARYDVEVHVPAGGGARVDNNVLKLSLKGDLQLVGTNARMGLLGTLNVEDGGRAFFRGNEFEISRGTVDFVQRDRIAAAVDVHAEGQVRDYKVWLHAYGPFEDPEIETQSEPELDRADVFALLTLGVTSRDQAAYSGAVGAGLVGETFLNIAGFDKRLKKLAPKTRLLEGFDFHLSTQYSELSGTVEPTAELEWAPLDSLKLRVSQPVISGRGRRAQVEYRIDEHMSLQGQWESEGSTSSLGDLGGDFKLRWELE